MFAESNYSILGILYIELLVSMILANMELVTLTDVLIRNRFRSREYKGTAPTLTFIQG